MNHIANIETLLGPSASADMREQIAADAKKTRRRQGVVHANILEKVFDGFVTSPGFNPYLLNAALIRFARLHTLIERGIPILEDKMSSEGVGSIDVVRRRLCGLVAFQWPTALAPHLDVLLQAYHRHGYLDLSDLEIPNTAGFNPASYLEVAMMGSNGLAVTTLLELGASRECVPAKEFAMGRGGERFSVAAGDFSAFIDLLYGSPTHSVRIAIDEGVRRRLAIDMAEVISTHSPLAPIDAAPSSRRGARL
jgi:hypothetical protein